MPFSLGPILKNWIIITIILIVLGIGFKLYLFFKVDLVEFNFLYSSEGLLFADFVFWLGIVFLVLWFFVKLKPKPQ